MAKEHEIKKPVSKSQVVALKLGPITLEFTGGLIVIPLVFVAALAAGLIYLVSVTTEPMLWLSAVLWILFIGYWTVAASGAAPTKSSESAASRRLHQLMMYGALVLAFVRVPGLDRRWLPLASYLVPVGLAVQAGSAVLAIWARRHLGRNWSGAIAAKLDHQLIRTGPYRLVRHPIYTGMLGMFLGTALVSGELHALLALLIISVAYWRKIRLEEQHLRNTFDKDFDEYRRKTWAVIPGLL